MARTPGAEIDVEIRDVAFGGRGVGRLEDGMTVFVPGTLVGERVKGRVTAVHKRYAEADVIEVLTASPQRVVPACPLSGSCGGCAYQHVTAEAELDIKQNQAVGLLTRIGKLDAPFFHDAIDSPHEVGYRNKVVLHAGSSGELGFISVDNQRIVDVSRCPLAAEPINECLARLRSDADWMRSLQPDDTVTFRWTEQDGVVCWKNRESGGDALTQESPLGPLRLPRSGFFQVNPAVADLLLSRIHLMITSLKPEYFVDLYCGIGVFALVAAQAGIPHVLGVENNGPALRAAKANARRLHLKNLMFAEGDAAVLLREAIRQVDRGLCMVLADPPRTGLSPLMRDVLVKEGPQHMIYISCAADTMARDLKTLTAQAYDLESCQVLNMFPRTAAFESLALLMRRAS